MAVTYRRHNAPPQVLRQRHFRKMFNGFFLVGPSVRRLPPLMRVGADQPTAKKCVDDLVLAFLGKVWVSGF